MLYQLEITPLAENIYNLITCLQDKVKIVTISGISDTMQVDLIRLSIIIVLVAFNLNLTVMYSNVI